MSVEVRLGLYKGVAEFTVLPLRERLAPIGSVRKFPTVVAEWPS